MISRSKVWAPNPMAKPKLLECQQRRVFSVDGEDVTVVGAEAGYQCTCHLESDDMNLLDHRLLAFAHWTPEYRWSFVHANGKSKETLTFLPYLSMNDYTGLATALLAGAGIGDLPPVVQPELIRDGRLVEVMPKWRFRSFDLSVVHLSNRHISRPVRVFKEFATQMAPTLFATLPA